VDISDKTDEINKYFSALNFDPNIGEEFIF
jgi:hypothetical protein